MKFGIWFRRIWWGALVLFFSLIVFQLLALDALFDLGGVVSQRYIAFLVWIVLLLTPVFSEISLLGLGVKQELEKIRRDLLLQLQLRNVVQVVNYPVPGIMTGPEYLAPAVTVPLAKRLYWLGNDLASLRFQALTIFPVEANRSIVEWQGQKAQEHARALKLPPPFIQNLERLLKFYLAEPGPDRATEFAQGILDLQMRVAEKLAESFPMERLGGKQQPSQGSKKEHS